MVAWRVDAQRVHIGRGIRLLFSLTEGVIAGRRHVANRLSEP
jgi:hypothetical protein